MCLHSGNTSEQTAAIPLEKEILKMIDDTKFIYCTDAGLGAYHIRKFNSMGGRAFIVTQSIKKLSDTLKKSVFNDFEYRLAKESELPQSTISYLFKRNNAPTNPTIEAICRAFGIMLAQFFANDGEPILLFSEQKEVLLLGAHFRTSKKGRCGYY